MARGLFYSLLFTQFEWDIRKFLNLHAKYSTEKHVSEREDFEPVDSSIVDKYPEFFLTHRLGERI